jgi:hypothetical protein
VGVKFPCPIAHLVSSLFSKEKPDSPFFNGDYPAGMGTKTGHANPVQLHITLQISKKSCTETAIKHALAVTFT